jgi:hypothetical protein
MTTFSKLFTVATIGAAFDSTIQHQAEHGRIAHVFVVAALSEFSLSVPETKAKFDTFSAKFISAEKNAGKAKPYAVTKAQGFALCEAFALIRATMGLSLCEVGKAWAKVEKVATPEAVTPATPEAVTPATPEAVTPATPEAVNAPNVSEVIAAILTGQYTADQCADILAAIESVYNVPTIEQKIAALMD